MRITSLLGLAYLTVTFAAPVEQASRDYAVFEKTFANIQGTLRSLTVAIKDLDNAARRGQQDLIKAESDIEKRADAVTQSLRNGANVIRKTGMLSLTEAANTVGPIEELGSATQRTVDAWIQQKATIVRAGGRQTVLKLLEAQETATDEFVDAVNGRMPLVSLTTARIYGQKARVQVDLAIAAIKAP